MNILTIAFLSLASAVTVLASGNDFSTIAVASKEERPARQTTSIENALKRANTTPVENPSMLRKGERRLLASVSTEYDPYEEHLLVRHQEVIVRPCLPRNFSHSNFYARAPISSPRVHLIFQYLIHSPAI